MKKTLFLLLLLHALVVPAWAKRVAVVLNRSIEAYEEALKGLQQGLHEDLTPINLKGNSDEGPVMQSLLEQKYDLTIAIGLETANIVQTHLNGAPFLYTMVYAPLAAPDHPDFCVLMQIGLEEQFSRLQQLFPSAKRIGVIYNPASSRKLIMQSRDLAQSRQLEMMPIAVETQGEIVEALNKMAEAKIDVLWSVVDRVASAPAAVKQVIEFTRSHKIPFIGLSKYHVKAGALAAFAVDFNDLGQQTAKLAQDMLIQPGLSPRVEKPRTVFIFVNSTTQHILGLGAMPSNLNIQYFE